MRSPVIFLAFANDQDEHLPLLDEERKIITGHLLPLASDQFFQLFSEPTASTADLSRYLAEFRDRVAIFHYGGHANSRQILLSDQAADASGVAESLAAQRNLKLVFLNGCSTREQVQQLFAMGVPVVIATSVPVGDLSAREFADIFYKSLATQHTLEEAFRLAAANYLMKKGEAVGVYRSLDLGRGSDPAAPLPWGLFVQPGREEVLGWQLPRERSTSFIVRGAGMRYQAGMTVNQKIIETIANAIAPYSEIISDLIESARRRGREPRIRDLRVAVIDSFPTPIGTHLRKLLLSEEISTERLRRITNAYSVAVEMLGFIMLAQLWDEKFHSPDFRVPEESLNTLRQFFQLTPDAYPVYNFVPLIRAVGDILDVNERKPFVTEFDALRKAFYEDSDLQKAHRFLEEMKEELQGNIAADEIESFCVQAEDHLCEVFRHLGFSAKYTLATIKTIELRKRRYRNPSYRHNLVILDKITAAFGVLDDTIEAGEFTENESVILLYSQERLHPFLNLSPFILDENALSGQQNSKIFFYRYRSDGAYSYVLVDNLKDKLDIDAQHYPQIRELFDDFLRTFSGE